MSLMIDDLSVSEYDAGIDFGSWLKAVRKERGISQEELGRAVGCTGSYISLLESDSAAPRRNRPARPSVEIVDAIARMLRVTRKEARLAAGYAPPDERPPTEPETRLLEFYRMLPPEVKHVVEIQIEALYSRYILGDGE